MTQAPPGAPPGMKPHRGVMILVFGILGLVCCLIFGIVAWIMGNGDLQEMQAGRMDPTGESLTKVGKILGIIAVALWAIYIVINVIFLLLGGGLMFFGAGAGGP